ncbi:uncharacterized protein LOC119353106 isoform X2 [Triticum dicoccoides]|uniref:uncharacterized protein LOC119353106 isoform X2 n=1 Tax=Triticum dicoccoides TaxID=85692 RepID=UPI00188E9E63|nr:uncharacterized protein LOC119353106 isoform X2 [Triticum dicoccoides]
MACTGRYSPSRWWPSSSTPIHICLGFYGRPAQSPTDSFSKQYNGHSRSASDLPSPPHGECPAPYHAHTVLSPMDASGLCSITGQHQRCEQKKGLVIGHPSFFIEVAIVHLRRGHPAIVKFCSQRCLLLFSEILQEKMQKKNGAGVAGLKPSLHFVASCSQSTSCYCYY